MRAHLPPPTKDAGGREPRRVMIDSHTDPTLVARQIVDPVRDRLAEFLVREVMDVDFLGLSLGLPFLAGVLEFPHQLLLLRVHRHDRLLSLMKLEHLSVDVLELGVAIGMPRALPRLAIGLQAITREFQKRGDRAIRHGVVLSLKFFRQLARALARPTQRRLRMTARRRIDQRVKGCLQSRVDLGQLLATATRTPKPSGDRLTGMCPAMFQVTYPRGDRVPCQARGDGNGGDATPSQGHRFGGSPLSPHSLVHHRCQGQEFLSNPFRRGRVSHAPTMRG